MLQPNVHPRYKFTLCLAIQSSQQLLIDFRNLAFKCHLIASSVGRPKKHFPIFILNAPSQKDCGTDCWYGRGTLEEQGAGKMKSNGSHTLLDTNQATAPLLAAFLVCQWHWFGEKGTYSDFKILSFFLIDFAERLHNIFTSKAGTTSNGRELLLL